DLFASAGCKSCRTYIQSGNVIFQAKPQTTKTLSQKISRQIEEEFGFSVPVILRTMEQLDAVINGNPFRNAGIPETTLYVYFLADWPAPERVSQLDPERSPGDEFHAI